MFELEENYKQLEEMIQRLQELGESLWHCKFTKRARKFRKTDITRRILEWYSKLW